LKFNYKKNTVIPTSFCACNPNIALFTNYWCAFFATTNPFAIFQKYNYKNYELKIHLNDGTVFSKKVPQELKDENLDVINAIKNELFNYKIKNVNASLPFFKHKIFHFFNRFFFN